MINKFSILFALSAWILQLNTAVSKSLDTEKIISRITTEFKQKYVFPEIADKMEQKLRKKLKSGAYNKISDPQVLAQSIENDLVSISNDKHISITYSPTPPPQLENDPEGEKGIQEQLKTANYYFKKVEILEGNIGYLKLNGFAPAEYAGKTAEAALKFLSNTEALIIDLRHNGGGSPSMVQLITSYFFKESIHLNSFYVRETGQMDQFWTSSYVSGKKYLDKDVYVLISSGTFSAAEEFSYNLKNLKRATLIGETSGGGAHPVNYHYLDDIKFGLAIPFGRAVNPITKTNWEGKGVTPHIKISPSKALKKTHQVALKKLIDNTKTASKLAFLKWSQESLKAKYSPLPLQDDIKLDYVGNYGKRIILMKGKELFYQRGKRLSKMLAVKKDRFAVEGLDYFRLQFNRNKKGKLVSVSGIYQSGREDKSIKQN